MKRKSNPGVDTVLTLCTEHRHDIRSKKSNTDETHKHEDVCMYGWMDVYVRHWLLLSHFRSQLQVQCECLMLFQRRLAHQDAKGPRTAKCGVVSSSASAPHSRCDECVQLLPGTCRPVPDLTACSFYSIHSVFSKLCPIFALSRFLRTFAVQDIYLRPVWALKNEHLPLKQIPTLAASYTNGDTSEPST